MEWSAEAQAGWGGGFGKGESAAIEEALSDDYLDYDYDNHDGENTADADVGNICVDADADSFAGEDVTAADECDDEDTGSCVSLNWEHVVADEICAESCCSSSSSIIISCSSSSSSSDSESVDISSCDDTCSSDSDASIISASSIGSRRRM